MRIRPRVYSASFMPLSEVGHRWIERVVLIDIMCAMTQILHSMYVIRYNNRFHNSASDRHVNDSLARVTSWTYRQKMNNKFYDIKLIDKIITFGGASLDQSLMVYELPRYNAFDS